MRKAILLLTIILIGLLYESCTKRLVPSISAKRSEKGYDSATFDYVFTEALKQKYLGNAGDALKYLEQCVKFNPQSDAAYYEMAQIAVMLSDLKNAKKFALKAASIDDKNIWYLSLVANIYYQAKVIDSAIIFYEKAAAAFPDKENLKLELAGIYSENAKYEKADDILNSLEKKYGPNETTTIPLVKNLINSGKFDKAEEKVKSVLMIYPDNVLYNGLLAEIYRNKGEKEKAINVYQKLMEREPGNPQTLLSLTNFLINEKLYDDLFPVLKVVVLNDSISRENKISLFSKMITDTSIIKAYSNQMELTLIILEADNKDDDIIVLLRPELLINENRLTDAITRLEEIIADDQENYYAWERLLFLYSETKNWDKLLERGEQCATKFNRSFPAKVLYASAAMEKGKLDLAVEELRKAKILAGSDTSKLVQVLVMDADVLYRRKEYSKSFEAFREALKVNPEDVVILNNYAYYLAEQGMELKEAERMAKLVTEKEKGNTTFLDTYAWVLYKRGRYKEALKIMEMIISGGKKDDAEWYEHIGYIYKALKNCDKAIENWRSAYKIDNRKSSLLIEIENCKKR